MKNEEAVRIFMENTAKVSARPIRVDGISHMNEVLGEILANETAIYCPGISELEKSAIIDSERRVDTYRNATVTVEESVAGIAETGSVVVSSSNGRAVQASVLPAHHIAILSVDNIFMSLDEFFTSLDKTLPTNITLITGPSRTADIELTLTIGVHGPERVSILVV